MIICYLDTFFFVLSPCIVGRLAVQNTQDHTPLFVDDDSAAGDSRIALVPELSKHHHGLCGQNARILGRQRWQAKEDVQGKHILLLFAVI